MLPMQSLRRTQNQSWTVKWFHWNDFAEIQAMIGRIEWRSSEQGDVNSVHTVFTKHLWTALWNELALWNSHNEIHPKQSDMPTANGILRRLIYEPHIMSRLINRRTCKENCEVKKLNLRSVNLTMRSTVCELYNVIQPVNLQCEVWELQNWTCTYEETFS